MKLVVTKRDTIIVWIVGLLATADLLGFFQGSVVEVNGIKLQKPFLSKYSAIYAPNSVEEDGQSYRLKDGMLVIDFEYAYIFNEIKLGFFSAKDSKVFAKCANYTIATNSEDRYKYSTSLYHRKAHLNVTIISNTKEDVHSFAEQICKNK